MKEPEQIVVLSTCPDKASAINMGRQLVQQRLAACVSIIDGVISILQWQGKMEENRECQLLIKTHRKKWPLIQEVMLKFHPYELPEIIAVPITEGLADYLTWIDDNVTP